MNSLCGDEGLSRQENSSDLVFTTSQLIRNKCWVPGPEGNHSQLCREGARVDLKGALR